MKQKLSKILIPALLLLPAIYIGYQAYHIFYRPYVTKTAIEYTMADSVDAKGIAVRSETLVHYSGQGMLGFVVRDGVRVAAGTVIGEAYADETSAQANLQLEELDGQIATLESSQNASVTAGSDVDILLKQSQNASFQLINALDGPCYSSLSEAKNAVALYQNRLQIATGETANFEDLLTTLRDQRAAVAAKASAPVATVTAPVGGYFVAEADGYEESAAPATIEGMTASQLQQYIEQPAGQPPADAVGKIEQDYKWHFYVTLPVKKASRFTAGQEVNLRFSYTDAQAIPATVVSVSQDPQADLVKVDFLCTEVTSDTIRLRVQEVQISFKSYTGLRIDKKALHIVDGVKGVYIRYGDMAEFKKVTPIYENDSYFLVPTKQGEGNEVSTYDEIIVEGKDLYDGKLLS